MNVLQIPPLEQRTTEPPLKRSSIHPLSINQDSPFHYVSAHALHFRSTPLHHVGVKTCPPPLFGILRNSSTWLSLGSSFDTTVGNINTTYLHICMIFSTLGPSPHGFPFGLYPKMPHINGDICPYIYTHDLSHF